MMCFYLLQSLNGHSFFISMHYSQTMPFQYILSFVNLFINFMIKNIDRIPLSSIELLEEPLSPLKNNIKILKKKLP